MKIVPDELRAEAERKALEDLGFIVISITTVPSPKNSLGCVKRVAGAV